MIIVDSVFEEGLVFAHGDRIDEAIDLLTPKECLALIKDIQNNLFEWGKLTKRAIDWKSLK